jgi:hypothetical protein
LFACALMNCSAPGSVAYTEVGAAIVGGGGRAGAAGALPRSTTTVLGAPRSTTTVLGRGDDGSASGRGTTIVGSTIFGSTTVSEGPGAVGTSANETLG